MDPITLATVTSAVTVLASEFAKGALSEAGKDTWAKVKALFRWKRDPQPAQLAPAVAKRLQEDEELAKQIIKLLQQQPTGTPSSLVGSISIDAQKVAVTNIQTVDGDLTVRF